jgi:carnitine O-palmitoyltransferase 1
VFLDEDSALHLRTHVVIPPPRELLRRSVRSLKHLRRSVAYSVYPLASPAALLLVAALVAAVALWAPPTSWVRSGPVARLAWWVSGLFPWYPVPHLVRVGLVAAWVAVAAVILLAWGERLLLRLLLRNKAWLREARRPSTSVRLWFLLVRTLTRGRPLTFSFQSSLPRLPVPRLADTVQRYLAATRLLQDDETFRRTEELAASFLACEGPRLNRYLVMQSWLTSNYVTPLWEEVVYLRGRSPLPVNSNYYILDAGRHHHTHVQEARAAVLTWAFMRYKEQLEDETVPPVMVADGAVPLDMAQCERLFATSRVPGREVDAIKHWPTEQVRHVAVSCRGTTYRLNVYRSDGSLRGPEELEALLADIKRDAAGRQPRPAEAGLPALTAESRTRWAEVRETHFSEGANRRSLDAIERSLFWLALDDTETELLDWTGRGRALLVGNRATPNIFFDKSVSLVVFANGKAGLNCEHSWGDAPVASHLLEVATIVTEETLDPYDAETGHVRHGLSGPSPPSRQPPGDSREEAWARLPWALSADAEEAVLAAVATLHGLMDDVVLRVDAYSKYGKDFVKRCRVSPDAFVQLAMQLAYFRDRGRFDNTYESSMTRLFLHGRTETVRPVTSESISFVRAMEDAGASPLNKLHALQAAAARHVRGFTDAMAGLGVDRHLFALYCVAVGSKTESPFLKGAVSLPWKLSTSQQPQQQTTLWDIKDAKWAKKVSPGGGFGPVDAEGYGVSYMVSGEREFFFHISALERGKPHTDVLRFQGHLFAALDEMREVLTLALSHEKEAAAAAAAAARGAVGGGVKAATDVAGGEAAGEGSGGGGGGGGGKKTV